MIGVVSAMVQMREDSELHPVHLWKWRKMNEFKTNFGGRALRT